MRGFFLAFASIVTVLWVGYIINDVRANFEYDNTVQSYWELSVKASTLQTKTMYLNQYVTALDDAHLCCNAAWIWQTRDNDYGYNYTALKSLQTRMQEIQSMDVKSFEYQQAISQITAQEQGEAETMLSTFKTIWFKCNHTLFWGPYEFLGIFGLAVLAFVLWCGGSVDF
jgi:hypothetical protein